VVIVDTTVWIDYLHGIQEAHTIWLDGELERQRLGLTDLILCEVLQGIREERQAAETERELLKLQVFETGGVDLAIAAAQNYRALRARGRTVRRTVDCLIATYCLTAGHILLHNHRDFDPFEEFLGLRVIHPEEQIG
jgi:predicted nucleic acid-binding protein